MKNLDIGYSELSEKVYIGEYVKKGTLNEWKNKKDITGRFLQVMEQKFPINTTQLIRINGENKYRILVVGLDKEVIVNGKKIQ